MLSPGMIQRSDADPLDLVELGLATTRQEFVELAQEAQVGVPDCGRSPAAFMANNYSGVYGVSIVSKYI